MIDTPKECLHLTESERESIIKFDLVKFDWYTDKKFDVIRRGED